MVLSTTSSVLLVATLIITAVKGCVDFTSSNAAVFADTGSTVNMQWTYALTGSTTTVRLVSIQRQVAGSWVNIKSGGPTDTVLTPVLARYTGTQKLTPAPVTVKLVITNVKCDEGAHFRIQINTADFTSDQNIVTLTVRVPPTGNPTLRLPNPAAGQILASGQNVTFTCSGHLGSPAGTFEWTREKSGRTTPMPSGTTPVLTNNADGCSKDGASTLTVVLTKEDNGAAYRGTTKADPSLAPVSLSATSEDLNVAYGVTVSPKTQSITVLKTQSVTLTYNADGNPAPAYSWTMGGQTLPGETASTYTIQADTMAVQNDLIYVCMASNTVNGAGYNVTKTFSVSITDKK